jgi:Enoyl-(Acyl carrier protein) reductase
MSTRDRRRWPLTTPRRRHGGLRLRAHQPGVVEDSPGRRSGCWRALAAPQNAEKENPMPKPLQDKAALVAGGSRGIGAAIATTVAAFGGLDVLVDNAGTAIPKKFEDTTRDEMNRVIDINVRGTFVATQAAPPTSPART